MPTSIHTQMPKKDWLLLVFLSVLWGASFFFIELGLESMSPLTVVTLRASIAALLLWLALWASKTPLTRTLKTWRAFFVMGLLGIVIPFLLITWAQVHINSSLASILNATSPIFAVLIASVFLPDEHLTWNKFFGVLLGFVGVVVLIGSDSLQSLGVNVIAKLVMLVATFCYALAGVYGRRFGAQNIPPMMVATGQLTTAAMVLLPMMFVIDGVDYLVVGTMRSWLAMLGLAALSTALAFIVFFKVLASSGATNVLLVTFLIPISAILLGVGLLNETLHLMQLVGMGLILSGLLIIDGRIFHGHYS